MANITASMVNALRQRTGLGLMDCKKALVESNGDEDNAIDILKKKGAIKAAKKADREAAEGIIESYIHMGGKVGVMLELNCESDFVAKNDAFKDLARDICMHIAAASPIAVSREEVSEDIIAKEREVAEAQAEGKPPAAIEKIVEGKINKFLSTVCLVDQAFVKNTDQTVGELITESIQKIGENIKIKRFARFSIGE
ncbi:translation elongation factor Ts [Rubellicoccus peritrichatus]|uniref:Elongation factor Ts n=1 Tax=Rubellicoccus peritrichatus TaxID=3080537 RepID=A0AAQ3QT21_9BACT|nr:translation elongation factor Ts [Puniceicoccus sp. CR14]WOO40831.1 translation elongation factor Ts [Puniceicoccus sp. CR14]